MDDLEEAINSLRQATNVTLSRTLDRLMAAHRWATLARRHAHEMSAEAYKTTMTLPQHALTIRPTLSSQYDFLSKDSRYRTLALDAASYAIEKGDLTVAIEILEQGRTLLWSQMRGFRNPLERLSATNKELADRFANCSRRLEALTTSSEPRSAILDGNGDASGRQAYGASENRRSIDEMIVRMRQLSREQEEIINEIRRIPGFEEFLQTSPFAILRQSAAEGPIIVLNHSEYRCDVLVVLAGKEAPCVCVPLDNGFYADANALHDELVQVRRKSGVSSVKYDEVL